jgi:hypothetical protein
MPVSGPRGKSASAASLTVVVGTAPLPCFPPCCMTSSFAEAMLSIGMSRFCAFSSEVTTKTLPLSFATTMLPGSGTVPLPPNRPQTRNPTTPTAASTAPATVARLCEPIGSWSITASFRTSADSMRRSTNR